MLIDSGPPSVYAVLLSVLFGLVTWFVRHNYLRLERELKEERTLRATEVAQLRKDFFEASDRTRMDREIHRQEMANAINGVGQRVQDLRDKVLSDCINEEHLGRALKPVMDKLGEIRTDMKDIYLRLERKQDRPGDD